MQDDPTLASVYGVKRNFPLNQLKYFHVADGLPANIAHDMFEGFVPERIEHILKSLVSDGLITIDQLNEATDRFPYSVVDKANKPVSISMAGKSPKLKFTQSQMWTFARLLSLFIGEHIPENESEDWTLLLDLLDVIECLYAPAFDAADLVHPKIVIGNLHQGFCRMYLDETENIKPKRHYSIHYASLTKQFGPLLDYSNGGQTPILQGHFS